MALPAEELEKRKKRLDALIKGDLKPRMRNRRYVVNFDVPGTINPSGGSPQVFTQSFTVKADTVFDVRGMERAWTLTGTLAETGESAQITAPPQYGTGGSGPPLADWAFKVYDSGSDREWQNDWVPANLLLSENLNGAWFGGFDPGARALLSSGSEVIVTLAVSRAANLPAATGLSAVTSQSIQISFFGVEVQL